MAHDVQHTASLKAGGSFLIAEMHRNLDAQAAFLAKTQEVHMDDEIANGVELHIAGNAAHFLAVHVEVDEGGGKAAGVHLGEEFLVVEG